MTQKHQVYVVKNNKCIAAINNEWMFGKDSVSRLADFIFKIKQKNSPKRALRLSYPKGELLDSSEFDPMAGVSQEGITIVDVTNLQDIKYCFMNINVLLVSEKEVEKFKCLSAEDYLLAYYPELSKLEKIAIRRLSKYSVMEQSTIQKTFSLDKPKESLDSIVNELDPETRSKVRDELLFFLQRAEGNENNVEVEYMTSLYDSLEEFLDHWEVVKILESMLGIFSRGNGPEKDKAIRDFLKEKSRAVDSRVEDQNELVDSEVKVQEDSRVDQNEPVDSEVKVQEDSRVEDQDEAQEPVVDKPKIDKELLVIIDKLPSNNIKEMACEVLEKVIENNSIDMLELYANMHFIAGVNLPIKMEIFEWLFAKGIGNEVKKELQKMYEKDKKRHSNSKTVLAAIYDKLQTEPRRKVERILHRTFIEEKLNNKNTQITPDELLSLYDQLDFLDVKTKMDIYEWIFIAVNSIGPNTEQKVREEIQKMCDIDKRAHDGKIILTKIFDKLGYEEKEKVKSILNRAIKEHQDKQYFTPEYLLSLYSEFEFLGHDTTVEIYEWIIATTNVLNSDSVKKIRDGLKTQALLAGEDGPEIKKAIQEIRELKDSGDNKNLFNVVYLDKLQGFDHQTKEEIFSFVFGDDPDIRKKLDEKKESIRRLDLLLAKEYVCKIEKIIREFIDTYLQQPDYPETDEFFDIFYSKLEGLNFQTKKEIFEWVVVEANTLSEDKKKTILERLEKAGLQGTFRHELETRLSNTMVNLVDLVLREVTTISEDKNKRIFEEIERHKANLIAVLEKEWDLL